MAQGARHILYPTYFPIFIFLQREKAEKSRNSEPLFEKWAQKSLQVPKSVYLQAFVTLFCFYGAL